MNSDRSYGKGMYEKGLAIRPATSPAEAEERAKILQRIRALIFKTKQIFTDADHWNRTHPDEEPINPDPYGNLKKHLEFYTQLIEREDSAS